MGKVKTTIPHACNILHLGTAVNQLWQFSLAGGNPELNAELKSATAERLPPSLVAKTWRSMWRRKLNIAWLPADQVFLKVVRFPACAPEELQPMVEMQLEKLSPIPVNQVVWSAEVVPTSITPPSAEAPKNEEHADETAPDAAPVVPMQTVVVVLAARNLVEQFLGQLEGLGYSADRLEFPALHHLLMQEVTEDSVWIYAGIQEGKNAALVAWWVGGLIQHISFLHLTADDSWKQSLIDQLNQTAWSGEMEGWLKQTPRCHLIAEPSVAALWDPIVAEWVGTPVTLHPALKPAELANLSAQRLARRQSQVNLLPSEYAVRYRQQLTDRIWMRGLGAVVVIYLVGVLGYFGALEVLKFQFGSVQKQVMQATPEYKKTLQLRAKVQVLQDRESLKYAALDCFKAAAELLPEDITLNNLSFQRGKVLMISGTVPSDQVTKVTEFNQALSGVTIRGQRLFNKVNAPATQISPNSQSASWSFTCELQQLENE
jgi:hypothetical protein